MSALGLQDAARWYEAWRGTEAARGLASGSWELGRITRRPGMPMVQDMECVTGMQRLATAALQDRCKINARWDGLRGTLGCGLWARTLFGASVVTWGTTDAALGGGARPLQLQAVRWHAQCERRAPTRGAGRGEAWSKSTPDFADG